MDSLDVFINEIIEAKQLPGMTEEAKVGVREEMKDRLLDLINRALIEALPEDTVSGFMSLLDKEGLTQEEVQSYITASGVDVELVTRQVLSTFRDAYLTRADAS